MAVIRTEQKTKFTVISNNVFADHHLTWEAMGMLSYLLEKPDNWKVIIAQLEKVTEGTRKETGERGVRAILNELKEKGYVIVKKRRSGCTDYFVYDNPQTEHLHIDNTANCSERKQPKQQIANTANCSESNVLINTERPQQELRKDKQELIGDGVEPPPQTVELDVNPKHKTPNPDNVACWKAYAKAYRNRYGVLPVTNAKTRGQAAQLVRYVGAGVAPKLAAYYVSHPDAWYLKNRHEFGLLLKDYQRILTDMQRNEAMTQTQARQAERTQSNLSNFQKVIDEMRAGQGVNHG